MHIYAYVTHTPKHGIVHMYTYMHIPHINMGLYTQAHTCIHHTYPTYINIGLHTHARICICHTYPSMGLYTCAHTWIHHTYPPSMGLYTHAHTSIHHTYLHTHKHGLIHTCTYMHIPHIPHIHKHRLAHTCMYMHMPHIPKHGIVHMCTYVDTPHMPPQAWDCTHMHIQAYTTHTSTHTSMSLYTCAHTCIYHTYPYTHKHGLVHTCTYKHTPHILPHRQAWACTYMHTQVQTHTKVFSDSNSGSLNQNLTEMRNPWLTALPYCCYPLPFCLIMASLHEPAHRQPGSWVSTETIGELGLLRISGNRALKGLTWSSQ